MNNGKYIFAQIMEFLPNRVFDRIVLKHFGDKYIKHFSCYNQLLCLIFGQLCSRESLRDLTIIINAHQSKMYHLGFGKNVSRSNLSKANEHRSYEIFEEFAYHLISVAQSKNKNESFEIKGKIYAFDATTIDLCLNVFKWANFRKNKAGIKLHTQFEISTQLPVFIYFTAANVHDVKAMDFIIYELGAYYIFDKAYIDFLRLFAITKAGAFFVIRAKINLKWRRIYSLKIDKLKGVLLDQIGKLTHKKTLESYPEKLRKIKYYDEQTKKTFIFLTNNFELTALQIALLYKQRWQIELFFKWIKQHLKIKTFWGTSENAVRIQINIAIITFCLISIISKDLKINRTNYEILQILSMSLLDKTPINELLMKTDNNNVNEQNTNQLVFNLF
jgi:Domain of unknown function (DUF4372)/Transposase DDE domain